MEQNPRFLEGHIECFVSDSSKSDQPCVLLFQSVLCLCATATLSSNASLSIHDATNVDLRFLCLFETQFVHMEFFSSSTAET